MNTFHRLVVLCVLAMSVGLSSLWGQSTTCNCGCKTIASVAYVPPNEQETFCYGWGEANAGSTGIWVEAGDKDDQPVSSGWDTPLFTWRGCERQCAHRPPENQVEGESAPPPDSEFLILTPLYHCDVWGGSGENPYTRCIEP